MTETKAMLHWPATGLFPVKVVGAWFYRNELSGIAENQPGNSALVFCTALLIPERGNPHDPNAVLVMVGSEKIGHLSRENALEFRGRLNSLDLGGQTTRCGAVISGGLETAGRIYDYITELDLDLSSVPRSEEPAYPSIDRRNPNFPIERQDKGRYFVRVWLGEGVLDHMHKRKSIHCWTTEDWDTVNYYVLNSKGIGLGHKLFSVPKAKHSRLFGKSKPTASFYSLEGRNAVIELAADA